MLDNPRNDGSEARVNWSYKTLRYCTAQSGGRIQTRGHVDYYGSSTTRSGARNVPMASFASTLIGHAKLRREYGKISLEGHLGGTSTVCWRRETMASTCSKQEG